jgi:hypothetical protein
MFSVSKPVESLMYLQHIAKDLGIIEAPDRNSSSGKLGCLIFKLAFSNRSLLEKAQPTLTIRMVARRRNTSYAC